MRYGRRMGRRTFQSRVKRVLMRTSETKFYQGAKENLNLYHNNGTVGVLLDTDQHAVLFNPWKDIVSGTGQFQRIGDKIMPRIMTIRLWLATKLDRPNVIFRIIVCRLPKIYGTTATTGGNLNIFREDDSSLKSGNNLTRYIDNDKGVRAYYDRCITVNTPGLVNSSSGGAVVSREVHRLVKISVKRKKSSPIVYQPGGEIVNNPLAVYVLPYDSYGTLLTDNIASCAFTYRIYYKDL